MKKFSKKYNTALEKLQGKENGVSLVEACTLVTETSVTKFDSSAEIHIVTGCDPRHADQIVRSTVILPNGTGKTVRIAVFCEEEMQDAAKKAGADIVGSDKLIQEVSQGKVDFDIAITTPSMMKALAKVARVLGPKGMMPSPKSGTVTPNVAEAVEELKKGKIEFRTDKTGIVHSIFGKVSFGPKKLEENLKVLLKSIIDAKPSGVKGTYIKGITVTTTMGPGIRVLTSEISGI